MIVTPRKHLGVKAVTGMALGLLAMACSPASDSAPCGGEGCLSATGDADAQPDGGDGPVTDAPADAPAGCDPLADPKESGAAACADDLYGVFVSPTGDDGNPGTKASPVRTIGAGLGKRGNKPRVYVCTGTYAEHVKATGSVLLIGGVGCADWKYTGTKTELAPSDAGYALEVATSGGAVTVSDFAVRAQAATVKGASSVAIFTHGAGGARAPAE